MMKVIPVTMKQANEFVLSYHRHHGKVRGCKFCIGATDEDGILHGVATPTPKTQAFSGNPGVGRPVSRYLDNGSTAEVTRLSQKLDRLFKQLYSKLTPWQKTLVARHPSRPHCLDYVAGLIEDFEPLCGDRCFGDDMAMVGGIGRFKGRSVIVIGQEKGSDLATRVKYNFGMAKPEGYRKAMRLMHMAERFGLPIITFIDTPGAYPGVGAEERSQAGAIAESLKCMAQLKTPIICTVIGEGGSGGALAIGVGDRVNMLQYSTYSVISPEGCASILWKSADKAPLAAEAMNITADKIKSLKLIDEVIKEPLGGAHRDYDGAAEAIRQCLTEELAILRGMPCDRLIEQRFTRLMSYGYC